MKITDVIALLTLFAQYGLPPILDALEQLKNSGNEEPTVDEIKTIVEGVPPPDPEV